jgi:hypothetical protein
MQQNADVDMNELQAEQEQLAFDALQADLDNLDALHAEEEGDFAFQMLTSLLLSSVRTEVTELVHAEYPDEESAREGLDSATEGRCCRIEPVVHSYHFAY